MWVGVLGFRVSGLAFLGFSAFWLEGIGTHGRRFGAAFVCPGFLPSETTAARVCLERDSGGRPGDPNLENHPHTAPYSNPFINPYRSL